ncbi:pilus assembly protein [Rhizobium sp. BE258]|uniref:pilus assembly protein n=1 Tax=Rhizobium sp. BE258 TaxID=2817722 RepID=UPI002863F4AB|nr:pilus assembly protein [Rhizobium sp. BE258]MDR7146132.1 Flp pilus assembly protein TadG [Rhizobium sp. BE258]
MLYFYRVRKAINNLIDAEICYHNLFGKVATMKPSSYFKHSKIDELLHDRGGNFAMMTGLLAVPLILAAGVAVDYSMAAMERTNLQQIADGAALAGGKIFDGTNLSDAQAAAKSFITSYADKLPKDVAFNITANGRTLQVAMTGTAATSFMKFGGFNSTAVGVTSAAISPLKPEKVTFTPTKAQGYWYKQVSVRVVREGSTAETVLATVEYTTTTHANSGSGTMVVKPSSQIDLGKYTKLVLQMDIKKDGCPLKKRAVVNGNDVKCESDSAQTYNKYDATMRTDNPQTTNYLFVDGKQLPQGVTQPLESYFGCSKPQSHAWEDGGGWERQDFFYTVSSECKAADGDYVRLTQ